jgi:SWI/SNF-related matrix-associated actin-dependent regulator 1 of chromatin subfamily A
MQIRKFRTKYHKYIFTFVFDQLTLKKVKTIQANCSNTWKDISFYKDEDGNVGWVFSSLEVLERLREEFDPLIDPRVSEEMSEVKEKYVEEEERKEKIYSVKKEELNENLEVQTKIPLFPFQKQAVDFIDKIGGRALVADDMGCGKTAEAIGYAVFKNYDRVLVICPSSVKTNWEREIDTFSGVKANNLTETVHRGGWEIIGYPNIEKFESYLKSQEYQLIIVDEAHYIKNKKAKRTKKTLNLLKKAKDIVFLTGTPVLNKPVEIYNIFNFITPMPFWTSQGFAQKYCGLKQDPYGRWDYTGATNLDELRSKMAWMIKRDKKEVIEQLPDKTIEVIETKMKDWTEYNKLLVDFRGWLKDKKLNEKAVYAEAITKVNYLKQIVVQNKNIKSELDNLLECGRKVIVFSQYRSVVEDLHEEYKNISVLLTGGTPTKDRQGVIDEFQNNDRCKIFFSTIKAGGVGITLTEADVVLFTDLSWTPADHEQAEDRAYRMGQKNNVNVYYLITPKTIEDKIWAMLKRKSIMVKKIMAGEKARKVHIKTLIKNL